MYSSLSGYPLSRSLHQNTDPYRPKPMFDGTEMQVTPVVNGAGNNVKNSSTDAIITRILSGERTVISHGISQYQVGGLSACGLVALNCTRIVLLTKQDGPKGTDLLEFVIKAKTARVRGPKPYSRFTSDLPIFSQGITSICVQWSSSSPLFSKSLEHESSEFGLPSFEKFRSALS